MQKLTAIVKRLDRDDDWDISAQKVDPAQIDIFLTAYYSAEVSSQRTKTFHEYTPLEIQKILDLAG